MTIDTERLRRDMADDAYAGAFACEPAMILEAYEIEHASEEELIQIARRRGFYLEKYRID